MYSVLKLSAAAFGLACASTFASAQAMVGMICFERAEMDRPVESRRFVVIMEQTNPEEQDGIVILNPKSYEIASPDMEDIRFRVRMFMDASRYLEDEPFAKLNRVLMNDAVPQSTFREWNDGLGYIKLGTLFISFDREREKQFISRNIEYWPKNRELEHYSDTVTGTDSRDVHCTPYVVQEH